MVCVLVHIVSSFFVFGGSRGVFLRFKQCFFCKFFAVCGGKKGQIGFFYYFLPEKCLKMLIFSIFV